MSYTEFLSEFYKHIKDLYGLNKNDVDVGGLEDTWMSGEDPYRHALYIGEKYNLTEL